MTKASSFSTSQPGKVSRAEIAALPVLPRDFYVRPAVEVARGLIGSLLVHGKCAGLIVEVEAYLGLEDRDAHAWHGRTPRTEVLFGPPGHAYVYLVYGMHECLNVVAEPENSPGCVLVRALQPVSGIAQMWRRRPSARSEYELCSGPGRLTLAMGIGRQHYGADLTKGGLTVRRWPLRMRQPVIAGPRIGIRHHVEWPLRFHLGGNPYVSRAGLAGK